MSDSAETSSFAAAGDAGAAGAGDDAPTAASYSYSPSAQPSGASAAADRPELAVGAAFAGGFLAALILKRIAG